jgi:hypothetical protein
MRDADSDKLIFALRPSAPLLMLSDDDCASTEGSSGTKKLSPSYVPDATGLR